MSTPAEAPLCETCFRQSASLLAVTGPAGNLLSRRLLEITGDRWPVEDWWPDVARDRAYWRCLTLGDPRLVAPSQVALGCLLLSKGMSARGLLLLRLSRPYLDPDSRLVVSQLFEEQAAVGEAVGAELQPGIEAHDRGDFPAALRIYTEVIARWPGDAWARYEYALTSAALDAAEGDASARPQLDAALLRNPFYARAVAMADTEERKMTVALRTLVEPVLREGDDSPPAVARFARAAMRFDHWSAAHAHLLMEYLKIPYPRPLLEISLTELGVEGHHDGVVQLLRPLGVAAEREDRTEAGRDADADVTDPAADDQGLALSRSAQAHAGRGEYPEAIAQLSAAIQAYDSDITASAWIRAVAHNNLAAIYFEAGDMVGARRSYGEAEELLSMEYEDDPALHAGILVGLAGAERNLGNLLEAYVAIQRAAELASAGPPETSESETELLMARIDTERGNIQEATGEADAAIESLRSALARVRGVRGPDHPENYLEENRLGSALGDVGQLTEAGQVLEASLRKRMDLFGAESREVATAYNNLALLHSRAGDNVAAIDYYRRCVDMRRPLLDPTDPAFIDSIAGLGACHAIQGEYAPAADLLWEAARADYDALLLAFDGTMTDMDYLQRKRRWISHLLATIALRTPAVAEHQRRAAAALINTRTAATGMTARRRSRDGAADIHGDLALMVTRYSSLAVRGPRGRTPGDYAAGLNLVGQRLAALQKGVRAAAATESLAFTEADQIARQLPDDSAFVDISAYFPEIPRQGTSENDGLHYVATTITHAGTVTLTPLAPLAVIEKLVTEFREEMALFASLPDIPALERSSADRIEAIGRQVYELILGPIVPLLDGAHHVVLSLDGALGQIPFACLVDERGEFAVERWMFTYISGVHDLHPQSPVESTPEVLVLAAPDFGTPQQSPAPRGIAPLSEALDTRWIPLKGTMRELEAVTEAIGKEAVRSLTGLAASKTSLLRGHMARVLHIATHAYYVPRPTVLAIPGDYVEQDLRGIRIGTSSEVRTGLVLAGANERRQLPDTAMDDGIVTALELSTILDLGATSLVLLSACQSGVGDLQVGDSVHGVRRACHIAGAQAVIACLWSVTDDDAAELVTALYKQLVTGESPASALHRATVEMLHGSGNGELGRRHPYRWAAYTLSGSVAAVLRMDLLATRPAS